MGFFSGIAKVAGNVVKTVAKAGKDTANATKKAVVDTGHVAGTVATSKLGQAVIGGALAVTGVGLPAAAAIGAAAKAGGNLIKPGGNLGKAANGAVQGAALGAGSAVVGAGVRAISSGSGLGGFRSVLLGGKGALKPSISGPPPARIEPSFDTPSIVPGVTDSGVIKHDATDLAKPVLSSLPMSSGSPKGTPIDLFSPVKRRLLGGGGTTKLPGTDVAQSVTPNFLGNGGVIENPATVLPSPESAPVSGAKKDNLPLMLAAGAAGVVLLTMLGRGRK